MLFKAKARDDSQPLPAYTYTIYPSNIPDGVHEFDGISIAFERPGWAWAIWEMVEEIPLLVATESGFQTRDAALVSILEAAKNFKNGALGSGA